MATLGSKLRTLKGGMVMFFCPGCKTGHQVRVDPLFGPVWWFNGDGDAPTFTPSILCSGTEPITEEEHSRIMAGEKVTPRPKICHSFVTDGRIKFLGDCTHALAGQTVDIPNHPCHEGV